MKRFVCAGMVLSLVCPITVAQNSTKTYTASRPAMQKVVVMAGQVSADGTAFTNNEINKWTVVNAVFLKGYEGKTVSVRCRVDPDAHTIHVLSVDRQRPVKGNLGDSAFRR